MSRRKKYFLEQKLFGLAIVVLTIASVPLLGGEATHAVLLVPMGLYIMFTKKMCLCNSYYYEMQEKRQKRHD